MAAVLGVAAVAAGCGGERQDANEPSRSYTVEIVKATFPSNQAVAAPQVMSIEVKNTDSKAIPNIGISVNSFERTATQKGLADPKRPVWIIDYGPESTEDNPSGGGVVAQNETWALGPLGPGQSKTFEWRVTPVDSGVHTVKYRVVAGLNGKAKAQLNNSGLPEGTFTVNVTGRPLAATVDPETGRIVRSSKPLPGGGSSTGPGASSNTSGP